MLSAAFTDLAGFHPTHRTGPTVDGCCSSSPQPGSVLLLGCVAQPACPICDSSFCRRTCTNITRTIFGSCSRHSQPLLLKDHSPGCIPVLCVRLEMQERSRLSMVHRNVSYLMHGRTDYCLQNSGCVLDDSYEKRACQPCHCTPPSTASQRCNPTRCYRSESHLLPQHQPPSLSNDGRCNPSMRCSLLIPP